MPGMLCAVRKGFDDIPDLIASRGITLSDCLMSGLALFCLKKPSLLQFEKSVRLNKRPGRARNLKSLFGVKRIPSDTWQRVRLDDVDPRSLRPCFKRIHTALQRGKVLEDWTVFGGYYLISIDGTGSRFSHKVKCKKCCIKNHKNGSTTYHHQMLVAWV